MNEYQNKGVALNNESNIYFDTIADCNRLIDDIEHKTSFIRLSELGESCAVDRTTLLGESLDNLKSRLSRLVADIKI